MYAFEGVVSGGDAVMLVIANEPGTFWVDDAVIDAGAIVPLWGAPPADAIPASYFGMHFNQLDTPWPQVGSAIGSVRIWDAGGRADGGGTGAQWPSVNPAPGRYDWSGLDARVEAARSRGADIVYTLGGVTPRWASSKPDAFSPYGPGQCAVPSSDAIWKDWVKAVVARYRGAIRYWEVWNEPDLSLFYCGTPEQLVRLARLTREAAREVDPQAVILSPGMSGYSGTGLLDQFLSNGGAEQVDTIAFHFYSDKPEDAALRTLNVRRLMERTGQAGKPLWNTEQGWIDTEGMAARYSAEVGAAYVARALLVNWALGHKRFYLYTWDNRFQLIDMTQTDRRTLTSAGVAFREVAGWMTGRVMELMERDSAGNFVVTLRDPAGARQRVLWNPDATVAFSPPASWSVNQQSDVAGKASSLVGVGSLQVGASPVLLESVATGSATRPGRRSRPERGALHNGAGPLNH
jgi:Glycosyl hydrolase catalytic core